MIKLNNVVIDNKRDYYEDPALSHSLIWTTTNHPELIASGLKVEQKNYQSFGSMVHKYILEPNEFSNTYFKVSQKPVNAQQISFCKLISQGLNPSVAYQESYSCGSKSLKTIEDESLSLYMQLKEYIEVLKINRDPILYDHKAANNLQTIHSNLIRNKFIYRLLWELNGNNEMQMFANYNGNPVKSKIDRIAFGDKTIYLIELKTFSIKNTAQSIKENIKESISMYHYDTQLAFYKSFIKEQYPKFTIKPVIISILSESPYTCRIYSISDEAIEKAESQIEEKLNSVIDHINLGLGFEYEYYSADKIETII